MRHDECYPPYFYAENTTLPIGWYSPGICPSGYTSAMNYTTTLSGLEKDYIAAGATTSIVPDEITVWCCPSNYFVPQHVYLACSGSIYNFIATSCQSLI
ncbi:hypothetical protein AOQ84DRAFT_178715 [Glonium stellatum]|uniref:Uncharacterized protein n=1 Tax=Glonium stellatum TaxID=574774 RepID=A0A8E2JZ38_9PEZI|nr:hypothetical protein AOQ84DRAFT_178715 [Glonium stellatum]